MGRFDGRVALVTGAARGQGRSHALYLAREGADVALLDICDQIPVVEAPMSTREDLAETVRLVEAAGRRPLPIVADVRDAAAVEAAIDETRAQLGRIDLVAANAGIYPTTGADADSLEAWRECIDVMLSGVYYTLRYASRAMLEEEHGGAMVVTGSIASFKPLSWDAESLSAAQVGYSAAKHGVLGIVENFAMALGQYGIRVNAVTPTGVNTPMVVNEFFSNRQLNPPAGFARNMLGISLIEPHDVSEALIWLLSDEARYVTGIALPVDAGVLLG